MKRLLFIAILLLVPLLAFAEPSRGKGISMHFLPMKVAKISGQPWGLQVSYADYLQPEPGQPYLQSLEDFVSYVKKQSASVQSNGAWVVITDPEAYSVTEQSLLEQIKVASKTQRIPLFVCRGKELPNGWKRYDTAP